MKELEPDEYSLIAWLEAQSLEAHNHNCAKCNEETKDGCPCKYIGIEEFANKTIAYLRNTRRNQRPHVGGRI